MMDRRHVEEENMVELYEASHKGCAGTLITLIQRDPLILNKVSLTSLSETPLHIAALLGHLEISRLLLIKKPKLAEEVDLQRRTPLHLASAEGHAEIVRALLQANTNICLVFDQEGRIPLHLAATRGRIEIIKDLIISCPESIRVNLNGDSVLHLCIQYNQLDALKLLVESANGDELVLNSKDYNGNSILHLAVMLKQTETIKYLLSVPNIKTEVNAMNMFEIPSILKESGVKRSLDPNSSLLETSSAIGPDPAQIAQSEQSTRSWFMRWTYFLSSSLVKQLKYQDNWMAETRGTLMVVATVISSMAFQAGISPPGGVWQENTTTGGFNCTQHICEAGTTVLAYTYPDDYLKFLSFNTTSFFASLSIILLVISGFPLTSKVAIWFLTLAMATAVTFMALTYLWVVGLATPDHLFHTVHGMDSGIKYLWIGLLVVVGVIHTIRLLSLVLNNLRNFQCGSTMDPSKHDPANV